MPIFPIDAYQRILIIGNGGSGKTYLADKLGLSLESSVIHLDDLRWVPGHYGIRRDNELVLRDVVSAGQADRWIIEGVYHWLASVIIDRTTLLIWLDLPVDECVDNVRSRGLQGGGSAESFQELLTWVADYCNREDSKTSFSGHLEIFNHYTGPKLRLRTRKDIDKLVEHSAEIAGLKR